MVLSLEEKTKLYEKANKLYESIKDIKIRREIAINVSPKYYDSNSRYTSYGFKYYYNGSISIFAKDIKDSLEELKNYIEFKNGSGPEYINGKSVSFLDDYAVNALLDFIYYGNEIKQEIERQNEKERKELNDLLS
jgi:hypothetical protein